MSVPGEGVGSEMSKFEQVSSDGHQMSLVRKVGAGTREVPCLMAGEGLGHG